MTRHWIGVACFEHVKRGISGGFAQVCHGKCGPLKLMNAGDLIVYYSPSLLFGDKMPYRRFTAIGHILPGDPYQFAMSEDFIPWRRNVSFFSAKETPIEPLIDRLSFILDKQRWGFPFKRGCFSVSAEDFSVIASAMEVSL